MNNSPVSRIPLLLLCGMLSALFCAAVFAAGPEVTPPVLKIPYTLQQGGKVSLLIVDAQGHVVRELMHAAVRQAGKQSEAWDGLDDKGKPAPAGTYTWKLLLSDGLKAEYLMSLGTNPTPDYLDWPGNHGGVSAVAADETGMYVSGGCGEGDPLVVKQSYDGKTRLWTVPHWLEAWMGGYSLGSGNGKLFLLQQNGVIRCIDVATGKPEARWDVLYDPADNEERKDTHQIMDLDAHGEQLVVVYTRHNAIRWINPLDGKTLDEAAVSEPLGVAVAPGGQVLVISKDTVVELTRDAKTPKPLITGLVMPYRLDVDMLTGEIFVAERGASQQVKRFSRDGKLLKAYGTAGGRPRQGRYDPMGFADIDDIAADGQGGFYIVEAWTAPRRVARFDTGGKLLREWYGGQQYANQGAADPADPRFIWIESHWGSLIQCKVDYLKRSWEVYATYNYVGLAEGLVANHDHGHGSVWKVLHREGKSYLVRESSFPCILQVDEANRRLVPVMASIIIGRPDLPLVQEGLKRPGAMVENANIALWVDRNADGNATPDEVTGERAKTVWGSGHASYDPTTFTFYTPRLNTWGDHTGPAVYRVQEWLPGGVPVYGFGEKSTFYQNYPDDFGDMQSYGVTLDKQGNLLGAFHTNVFKPIGTSGFGANGGNKVVKWDKDGKIVWVVGGVAPGSVAKPGEAKSFYSIDSAQNCAIVSDYADSMVHVWDEDGLWVGRLFDNPDITAAPLETYTLCSENFGNAVFEVPAGMNVPGLRAGDVLFIGGGQNNTPLFRITGWEKFRRQRGTVTITPAQAATLTARVEQEAKRPGVAHIAYVRNDQLKLDGNLDEWKDFTPLEIRDGEEVRAKVYLGWNNTGLFAAFDVQTDTPWKSVGAPTLAFQGGAALDINLGPLAPARQAAGLGDLRVVVSPINGTIAVEFLPVAPAGVDKAAVTYETGQGKITFDRVVTLPKGWVAMQPKLAEAMPDDEMGNVGYIIEVRLPVRAPFELRPGYRFKLDASLILADAMGKRSAVRLPWHSRAAGDMIVADTYHESLLRPDNWGEAVLDQ